MVNLKTMESNQVLQEDRFDCFVPPILECRLLIKELEKDRGKLSKLNRSGRERRKGYSLRIF
jgi:hypothetical protein